MAASPLTLPDLVVLALLAERPMHGYELNQELERREVADWAAISRPQVYYSLKKLAKGGEILRAADGAGGGGPERVIYRIGAAGRRGLVHALGQEEWALARPPSPFVTWLILAVHAAPADRRRVIERRRSFLTGEIARERRTLAEIRADTGPMVEVAELVVEFTIRQWELELTWLDSLIERFG